MRPTTDIHNAFTQFGVGLVAIALEFATKTLQKLPRPIPPAPHLKFKDHDCARPAELPNKRPVVAPSLFARLTGHGGFVGLNISPSQQLPALGSHHRAQQAAGGQDCIVERLTTQFDSKIFHQGGTLPINRKVQLVFAHQHFDNELVGKLALGNDLRWSGSRRHPLFLLTMRAALLPFDDAHPELGWFARQFFSRIIANHRTLSTALGALAILRTARKNLCATLQVFGQLVPSRMVGPSLAVPRQRHLLLSFGPLGFLLDLTRHETDFLKQQRDLGGGKLLALGTEDPEVQQPDMLILELNDFAKAGVFRLGLFQRLAQVGGAGIGRNHVMCVSYTHFFCKIFSFAQAALRHQGRVLVFSRSMPLNNSVSSSAKILSAPGSSVFGQAKQPSPKRLAQTHVPLPSK